MENLTELPKVWRTIYGEGRGYLALFSGVRRAPDARLTSWHQAFLHWPREEARALAWIAEEGRADRELYHCGHLLTAPRRRKENASNFCALYVDMDGPWPDSRLYVPTLLVETSPGHHQAYFALSRVVDAARGTSLNRRLALELGADASGWDATQLLRVPGGVNHKYEERPRVRIIAEHDARYDPDELEALVPQLREKAVPKVSIPSEAYARTGGAEPPVPMTSGARAIWEGQVVRKTPDGRVDRSASLVRIARILYQAGLAPEHIAQLLAERDVTLGWEKYSQREDAPEQYARIVAHVQRSPITKTAQARGV